MGGRERKEIGGVMKTGKMMSGWRRRRRRRRSEWRWSERWSVSSSERGEHHKTQARREMRTIIESLVVRDAPFSVFGEIQSDSV